MSVDRYDIAVIGGGHNGLVTAAYLAKAGRKVVLLERNKTIGGSAVSEALFPGFSVSSLVEGTSSFSAQITADLGLERFGLSLLQDDSPDTPLVVSPQKDGSHLAIFHDVDRTAVEISKFSKADSDAYPLFLEEMRKVAEVIAALNRGPLPDMPEVGFKDMFSLARLIKPVRALGWRNLAKSMRILTLSVSDLLDEWFESEVVKATLCASSLINVSLGPMESGTGYLFVQNFASSNNKLFRSSAQFTGGIGGLSQALAAAAEDLGVNIFTDSEVSQITLEDGAAKGVAMADGRQIEAAVVVSSADMRSTFQNMVSAGTLDDVAANRVDKITYNGTAARVHFALNGLPEFTGLGGELSTRLKGYIQIAPSITYLQKAFDQVKYDTCSAHPYLDIRIPTLTDPALAPPEKHLLSVTVKYMPYRLREGNWQDLGQKLGTMVADTITDYAPGFPECIDDVRVITPLDMETNYGQPEGSLVHGDISLDQSLWMRPIPGYTQYNSPIKNLYLCGAATHPGGGVTGINGANAARKILKDRR